jgi:hypothetical protein
MLVIWDEHRAMLPVVSVLRHQRIAEQVNQSIRDCLGLCAYCLFPVESEESTGGESRLALVMESLAPAGYTPSQAAWVSTASLNSESFRSLEEAAIVASALEQITVGTDGDVTKPFKTPGWIHELLRWTQEQVRPHGLSLTGEFRQLDSRQDSALLRLETDGQALWFKAVGNLNLREYAITLLLSHLFPRFLPTLVAARPEWHGWLARESDGVTLNESDGSGAWKLAAQTLAELQTESLGRIDDCLSAGCRDLRYHILLEQVDPFLEAMVGLMQEQRISSPTPLDKSEVLQLAAPIKGAIRTLAEFEVPDSLGHLDINPGNVVSSARQCVFLDWADAYVGPPFLTFEYLRACARQTWKDPDLDLELVKSYSARWICDVAPGKLLKAYEVSPLVAVFAYASGTGFWKNPAQIYERRIAGYFRSLTRRIQKEAQTLADRRRRSVSLSIERSI